MSPPPHSEILAAICGLCLQCQATCISVVTTSENIVIASDSKEVWFDPHHVAGKDKDLANKVVVLDDRVAVGVTGFGGGTSWWDAFTFLYGIKNSLPVNASVSVIDGIIVDKLDPLMNHFSTYAANASREQQLAFADMIVMFIVIGYEGNVPVVDTVVIPFDGDTRKVSSPAIKSVYPTPHNPRTFGFNYVVEGEKRALRTATSKAYSPEWFGVREFPGLAPIFHRPADITLIEATATATDIVRFEAKFCPKSVGPPINLVMLSRKDKPVVSSLPN
jgi:hypothetical protein